MMEADRFSSKQATDAVSENNHKPERKEMLEELSGILGAEAVEYVQGSRDVFEKGVLNKITREMLGLAVALVSGSQEKMRSHLHSCLQHGVSRTELGELFAVVLSIEGPSALSAVHEAAVYIRDNFSPKNKNDESKNSERQIAESKNEGGNIIKVYTDGSCRGNPGPGAYAAVIFSDESEQEITGFEKETTNNRMELRAVIESFKYIKPGSRVRIYSDSIYLLKGLEEWLPRWKENGWQTSGNSQVKNQDLWCRLDKIKQNYQLQLKKVKAHSGHSQNERVDELAKKTIADNENKI